VRSCKLRFNNFRIFAILSVLILLERVVKQQPNYTFTLINQYISNGNTKNKNLLFIRKIFKESSSTNISYNTLKCDIIVFIKLLELYFFEKYNKSLDNIKDTLDKVNVADFINSNLFLFEEVYDKVGITYKNFKEKIYWNFGEIVNTAYQGFPKMVKKTIYRHLNLLPLQESLLYNIIQYYYSIRNFRKCKILIRVNFLN
jgi:hypothetical protein